MNYHNQENIYIGFIKRLSSRVQGLFVIAGSMIAELRIPASVQQEKMNRGSTIVKVEGRVGKPAEK